jgi:hypothetical protein
MIILAKGGAERGFYAYRIDGKRFRSLDAEEMAKVGTA